MTCPHIKIVAITLVLMALASCNSSGTAVELVLQYDDSWGLDTVRLSSTDNESQVPIEKRIRIVLPDSMAGVTNTLIVDGFAGDERIAHASVDIEPVLGETSHVTVTLVRIPCGAWCTPGATTCFGDGVAICEERDTDSCLEWSETIACTVDSPSCSIGECRDTCINECSDGEATCEGPGGLRRCGQSDSDSCLDWLPAIACPAEQSCSAGACREQCQDACVEGESTCLGDGTVTCGDLDFDGCTEWSPVVPCDGGQSCSGGSCSESCSDDCSDSSCNGLSFAMCGQFDTDSCLDLGIGVSCVPSNDCQEGMCTSGGCESASKVCDAPPESTCIASDTLLVYDAVGECTQGTCNYEESEIDCPNCPACDACAGVTCDSPPAPTVCYQSSGTCTDGSCDYIYDDTAGCDDSDSCTENDTCSQGVCAGTEKACLSPPVSVCTDGTTLRTYSSPGSCTVADCDYPFLDQTCSDGCTSGACNAPVCETPTCEPETFASGRVWDIALDGTHVYWNDYLAETVVRRAKTDGAVETLATGQGGGEKLALDDTHIYWTNGADKVLRGGKSGGAVETLATGQDGAYGIALDDTHVYWTNYYADTVMRKGKSGGAVETLATGQDGASGIALDDTHVYWVDFIAETVMRRSKSGGAVEPIATGQVEVNGFALDGTHVYWANYDAGTVMRRAKSGGVVETFATGQDAPLDLVLDATHVYWTNDQGGTVMRRAKSGGTVETLATGLPVTSGLAIDGDHIYWGPGNTVVRLSRCACDL